MNDELTVGMGRIQQTKFQDVLSEEIWTTTYKYHEDKTIDDTLKRVAKAIASVEETKEKQQEWSDKFYDMLSEFKALPGGRTIANAGAGYNATTLANCFVSPRRSHDIDSIDGILEDVLNQCQTLKSEGGWGQNFSFIRPRGAFIHGIGVETPGAVKYMEIYDKTSDIITSGSGTKSGNKKAKGKIRKGAMMAILDITHPDVEEFIRAKQMPGRLTKFNVSVNITDEFMWKLFRIKEIDELIAREKSETVRHKLEEEMVEHDKWYLRFPETTDLHYAEEWDGDLKEWENKGYKVKVYKTVSVTGIWDTIMESTYARAEPGVIFIDRGNHFNPLNYEEKIVASNPCVLKGTLVNTPIGYRKVEDIKIGDEICTVLGEEPVKNIEINENVETFKITFSDGGEEYVTNSHQYHFVPTSKPNMDKRIQKKRLDELEVGNFIRVEPTQFENEAFNQEDYNTGLKIGILLGDGCYTEKTLLQSGFRISSSTDDIDYNKNVKSLFGDIFGADSKSSIGYKSLNLNISKKYQDDLLEELHLTPSYSYEKEIDLNFVDNYSKSIGVIDGLISTDGNVNLSSGNPSVRVFTSSKKMAQDVRRLFLYFGVHAQIHKTGKEGDLGGNIDGRIIERKHDKYQISFTGASVKSFYKHTKLAKIHPEKGRKLKEMVINTRLTGNLWRTKILSIEPYATDCTYDLFCEDSDTWITSGYVQVGCGEQLLSSGNICTLGTLNLTQFVSADGNGFDLDKVKKYTRYLVRFLDNVNTYSHAPLPEYKESMIKKRRIGIGVMGWGSALYMIKVRFGSIESNNIREELMSTISRESYMGSIDLAEEKGKFGYCDPEKHAAGAFIRGLNLSEEYMEKERRVGIRNASLLSCQPNGNCVTKEGKIKMMDGSFYTIEQLIELGGKNIDELEEGDVIKLNQTIIPTFEGQDSFDSLYVNGMKPVLEIELENGISLKQTYNHKYLIKINDKEADWIEAKDLKPGMKIISSD